MDWDGKRYNNLSYYFKNNYGEKYIKLSLDGGFNCPNRDGKISHKGCIFCSEKGSGEFAGDRSKTIDRQIKEQIESLKSKWGKRKYIAYFQNFTNTYGSINYLRRIYNEAINNNNIEGIAIATRPDCLSNDIIDLLNEIKQKTKIFWIELGLQTIHESSAKFINRGYNLDVFEKNLQSLQQNGINIVIHLIFGLPGEGKNDILETIKYISSLNIFGVKFHLLYVSKGTGLEKLYLEGKIYTFGFEEYIETVCDAIERLDKKIVIHRLTGDGDRKSLISPKWSLNKKNVLNSVDKELKRRDSYQGIFKNSENLDKCL